MNTATHRARRRRATALAAVLYGATGGEDHKREGDADDRRRRQAPRAPSPSDGGQRLSNWSRMKAEALGAQRARRLARGGVSDVRGRNARCRPSWHYNGIVLFGPMRHHLGARWTRIRRRHSTSRSMQLPAEEFVQTGRSGLVGCSAAQPPSRAAREGRTTATATRRVAPDARAFCTDLDELASDPAPR